MTGKILIGTINKAAEACGYKFHTGMEYRINSELKQLPAVWMTPPKLTEKNGRKEGIKKYQIKLFLIEKCDEKNIYKKDEVWDKLEGKFDQIIEIITVQDEIRAVKDIKIKPQEFELTNRGEISIEASFSVLVNF